MINPNHLRREIVRPLLEAIDLWSEAAEELLLGTAAVESKGGYHLVQIGGPALGIYQMEEATHNDIAFRYLAARPELHGRILKACGLRGYNANRLKHNLWYATAMARLRYAMVPEPLPPAGDTEGQARYWKQHYNTPLGKGTVEKYVSAYRSIVEGKL